MKYGGLQQQSWRGEPPKKELGSLYDGDNGQAFDQFAGKRTSYKEELYTSKIDETKITKELRRKAEDYEREILKEASNGNLHLAEERNQLQSKDIDETGRYEEMKYSGVYRKDEELLPASQLQY